MPKWVLTTIMVFCSALVSVSVIQRSSNFKSTDGKIPADNILKRVCEALARNHYKPVKVSLHPRKAGMENPMGTTTTGYGATRKDKGLIPPETLLSQCVREINSQSETDSPNSPEIRLAA